MPPSENRLDRSKSRPLPRSDKPGYRPDIEGLRAVAIVMVAVYHIWVGKVSGGVDIFLMISGFFVGASVVRSYSDRRQPPLFGYYRRVFARLLPPALIVIAFMLAAAWFLLPRTRMTDTAWQSLASMFYVENWYLATTGQNYGAADLDQSIAQHFWSLAVQGQIFVLLPLACALGSLLLGRFATRRVFVGLVVTLLVTSFGFAAYLNIVDPALGYFHTYARLWQFLAGTMLALVVTSGWIRGMPRGMREILSIAGLGMILATGVLFDGATQFPGPAALFPLVGAALVIVAGESVTWGEEGRATVPWLTRILASRPLVRAGGNAYGFYLWHWPVLVVTVALRDGRSTGWPVGTGVLVAAGALTWVTNCIVKVRERAPCSKSRRARERRSLVALVRPIVATTAALAIIGGSVGWLTHVERQRTAAFADSMLDPLMYPGALTRWEPAIWRTPDSVDPGLDPRSWTRCRFGYAASA
ncbi:MAG: acyltransferase family protein, partial [Cellulomonadaceae bacterium]